jgi:hypothetical protein
MPGVRLHHPSLRNCTYTLIHEGRPLTAPHMCNLCKQTHFHKTYHLGLDQLGDVVVSETIYERIKEAGLDELQATKEILSPDPQRIDMSKPQEQLTIVSREKGQP